MNETFAYIVSSLAWSLGGGFIGFLIGRMTARLDDVDREVHEVHEFLEGHPPPMATMPPADEPPRKPPPEPMEVAIVREPESKKRWWFGVVLLVLALASSVASYISSQESQEALDAVEASLERERALRQCVERRLTEFADNLEERGAATQRNYQEVDKVLIAAATATSDSQIVRALDAYQEARRLITRELRENPIERPETTCREENPPP